MCAQLWDSTSIARLHIYAYFSTKRSLETMSFVSEYRRINTILQFLISKLVRQKQHKNNENTHRVQYK